MATDGANGRRRAAALRRINEQAAKLPSANQLVLPTFNRFGADVLLIVQLEAIAHFLEGIEIPKAASIYSKMTVPELKKLAQERGGLMSSLTTKPTLIAALEAADKAAEKELANA